MTTAVAPDAWTEIFLVSVQIQDGSQVEFAGITEEISSFDFGDKDVESVATANGGRLIKRIPQADESITLKMYPVDALVAGGNGIVQYYHPQDTPDATAPIEVQNTRNRNKHQVVISWAEDLEDYTTAGQASTADQAAYRMTAKNAYMTSYKPGFDDKTLFVEATFKWAPFAKDGSSNKKEESTSTTAIPAATAFTS